MGTKHVEKDGMRKSFAASMISVGSKKESQSTPKVVDEVNPELARSLPIPNIAHPVPA